MGTTIRWWPSRGASSAKRSRPNPDLYFAVVTGCLRISKESIFTGINNLKVDTIMDTRYAEYFGFTEDDLRKLLADYGMEYALEDMRAWYDGYHFGNADVYCPWDVVNHCDKLLDSPKARPKPCWNSTSSNVLMKQFIDMADATTRGEIEQPVAGRTIRKKSEGLAGAPAHHPAGHDQLL